MKSPSFVDGRSLAPLLTAVPPGSWRNKFLIESWHDPGFTLSPPRLYGVRTANFYYGEYPGNGDRELYSLSSDPGQTENVYDKASGNLRTTLKGHLDRLKNCSGDACRSAEGG